MRKVMAVTKALADVNRVRAVMALRHGELCVCQIIELLEMAPSTVSKHMAILHQAGLVESRKQGRWIYYRVAKDAPPAVEGALRWVREALAKEPQVVEDSRRVKAIINRPREGACVCYT